MSIVGFEKFRRLSGRVFLPVVLAALVCGPAATGTALARFTCATNQDCAATAAQCDPGATPCNDGICNPGSPDSDGIGCVLIPNDSKCDDGQFCDGLETCDTNHGCRPGVAPNCSDQIVCTADSCDAVSNSCKHVKRDTSCSNGLFCDGTEICDVNLGCRPGTPPKCGDNVDCTVDACDEVNDVCTHGTSNGTCSNGVFCDGIEICTPSGCQPGTTLNCNDGIGCTADTCDEAHDICAHVPNNASCSNNNLCDGVETCAPASGCKPGTPLNCNDGLFCDGVEICSPATGCVSGTPPNCADNVACTNDVCNEANDSCSHIARNSNCSNGLFCDGTEICSVSQGCKPGTPPNCADSVSCTGDFCDEANDVCANTPNNALCRNVSFCDGAETCSPTQGCRPGTPVSCADSVACTTDRCVEATDSCEHVPNNDVCTDDKFCNGLEICSPVLGCQAGGPPNCSDNVDCTLDLCVEINDSCSHTETDVACDDGLFCTGTEGCDALIGCFAGVPPNCNDSVVCTVDACVEATDSCSHSASNALCSNGLFCDGAEFCNPVLGCQPGTAPNCADAVNCTIDTCVEALDACSHTPDNTTCLNTLFCDGVEVCSASLGCRPGTPPVCTDALTCTTDTCSEGTNRCLHTPNGGLCGNNIVDAACGEQCDEDNGEICNNLIDDDGDGLIDCADPDCVNESLPTCDEFCVLVPPCQPLQRDPAIISFGANERAAGQPGTFAFHAKLVPVTPIDPPAEGFVVTLSNAEGVIFRAELKASDLLALSGNRIRFQAKDPQLVVQQGGIERLSIRRRVSGDVASYGLRLRAYGDFSRATLARMTTQVYFGDDVGYVTATWTGEPGRWSLRPKDYDDVP